jgi:hypothetical protein
MSLRKFIHRLFSQGTSPKPYTKRCPVCGSQFVFRRVGGSTPEGGHWDGIDARCPTCGICTVDDPFIPDNDAPPIAISINARGWVLCPCCGWRFQPTNQTAWNGERHRRCGQRLQIQTEKA